jgi:hypothetical protein
MEHGFALLAPLEGAQPQILQALQANIGQSAPYIEHYNAQHQRVLRSTAEAGLAKADLELGGPPCADIGKLHARIKYNNLLGKFEIIPMNIKKGVWVNGSEHAAGSKPILLNSKDKVEVLCSMHPKDTHGFYFLLPKKTNPEASKDAAAVISLKSEPLKNFLSKDHKVWTKSERERFVKGILDFGHTRTRLLRDSSGLINRTVEEVHEFTISFFYRLLDFVTEEETEEKEYALAVLKKVNLQVQWDLDANDGSRVYEPSLYNWKKVEKNGGPWIRRIRNMHILTELVSFYQDRGVDILLGMKESFLRQRLPAEWWTADDDRNLLLGIYKHGYGNFNEIRQDPEFQFSPVPSDEEFPNQEKLNKRVKKLLDHARDLYIDQRDRFIELERDIAAHDNVNELYNAEKVLSVQRDLDLENAQKWSDRDVTLLLNTLMSFGLRRSFDGE